jgi:hypothetical protein
MSSSNRLTRRILSFIFLAATAGVGAAPACSQELTVGALPPPKALLSRFVRQAGKGIENRTRGEALNLIKALGLHVAQVRGASLGKARHAHARPKLDLDLDAQPSVDRGLHLQRTLKILVYRETVVREATGMLRFAVSAKNERLESAVVALEFQF